MRWTTRGLWRCSLGGKRILTHILVQGVPRATMSVLSRDSRAERVNEEKLGLENNRKPGTQKPWKLALSPHAQDIKEIRRVSLRMRQGAQREP